VSRPVLAMSLIAASLLSLSACGRDEPAPRPSATCPATTPVTTLPGAVSDPGPGQVRWSVPLDRCAGAARAAWGDLRSQQIGALGPGNELVLDLDGTISRFDLSTGARLWQRTVVAPAVSSTFDRVEVTSDLVMVALTAKSVDGGYAFLDARTGAPLGAPDQRPGGTAELVGGHVVIGGEDSVSGYDPRTGKTTWRVDAAGPAHDDTTLYLRSPGDPDGITRVDAATGRVLSPFRLQAAAHLTPSRVELFGAAQGELLLWEHNPARSSVARSVAMDTRTGALAWARAGQFGTAGSGPFSEYADDGVFTAVDPHSGRVRWTVSQDRGPGLYAVEPVADYLVQAVEDGADVTRYPGRIDGVPPKGLAAAHPAWRSAALPHPQLVAADQRTAVVSTCDAQGQPGCADRALVAIAL
jgi:outer membrane protein assembly factor BamB